MLIDPTRDVPVMLPTPCNSLPDAVLVMTLIQDWLVRLAVHGQPRWQCQR